MKRRLKIRLKRITLITLSIALFLGGGLWYVYSHYESIARKLLTQKTSELTNGLYHLEVGAIRVSLWDGFLSIRDIQLKVNHNRLEYLQRIDSVPSNLFDISVKNIVLKGIDFRKQRTFRDLAFSELSIIDPEVHLTHYPKSQKDSTSADKLNKKNIHEQLSTFMNKWSIADIHLDNGQFEYQLHRDIDTLQYKAEKINIHATGFSLDSLPAFENRIFYCEDIKLTAENARHVLPKKSFALEFGIINLSTSDSTLRVEKAHLVPQYPKKEFVFKAKDLSDWMELTLESLTCYGFDFNHVILNKELRVDSIQVHDALYVNFKDQNMVKPRKYVPLLHTVSHQIPIPIDIRRIHVQNVDVEYEELPKKGFMSGVITFNDINGDFYDFTNRPVAKDQSVKLVASGKLMNQGMINATFYLPADSANDRFDIKGTLGPMNVKALNRIVEPLVSARLESGNIQGMDFYIKGGEHQASLNMQLLYQDLEVIILREKHGEKVDWGLASMVANMLLIKKANPEKGKNLRRVNTITKRDPARSTFNYLWKTFFAGLIETAALDADKRERLINFKKRIYEVKSVFQPQKKKKT